MSARALPEATFAMPVEQLQQAVGFTASSVADSIPGPRLVEIPTGHLPMVERPEE